MTTIYKHNHIFNLLMAIKHIILLLQFVWKAAIQQVGGQEKCFSSKVSVQYICRAYFSKTWSIAAFLTCFITAPHNLVMWINIVILTSRLRPIFNVTSLQTPANSCVHEVAAAGYRLFFYRLVPSPLCSICPTRAVVHKPCQANTTSFADDSPDAGGGANVSAPTVSLSLLLMSLAILLAAMLTDDSTCCGFTRLSLSLCFYWHKVEIWSTFWNSGLSLKRTVITFRMVNLANGVPYLGTFGADLVANWFPVENQPEDRWTF